MYSVSAINRCLLCSLVVILFAAYTRGQCLSSRAVVFENKCYQYFSNEQSWNEAENYCSSSLGDRTLAKVSSPAELAFLFRLKQSGTFWVGASLNKTGKWTWTDKSEVNMTSLWGTGEPNNRGGDEKCVEINVDGKLNDLQCNASRQFVCMELKVVQTTVTIPTVVSTTTPPGPGVLSVDSSATTPGTDVSSTVGTTVAPESGAPTNNVTQVAGTVAPSNNVARAPGPVGFTAVLSNTLKLVVNQMLVYNKIVTNAGNAYNIKTGVFTCQTAGMYFFQFHCTASKGSKLSVSLVMNKTKVVTLHSYTNQDFTMAGNSAVLQLKVGDKVFVQASSAGSVYGTTSDFLNTFSGFLMQTSGV
ncbi:complement C1q subcomponent subunit B-like [Physella acuta]|uniref:complement C1q subcomponent subunit B-like n=1 Tax=Physella acuta TaxID=109671 RepID=UPI0027DE214F|nr:complement C1q subcomponent subunit B-like [Physella acuta]XP_059169752.1 complement C1q subcomponent subunit B-like [Physella acuta]